MHLSLPDDRGRGGCVRSSRSRPRHQPLRHASEVRRRGVPGRGVRVSECVARQAGMGAARARQVMWWKKQANEEIPMKVVWLITLALGLFLAPYLSQAQSVAKMPRIGILTSASDPHPILDAFRQGLRDLGYVEGQSIALEYRFADGRFERLPELAADLVRLKVDVILADGGPETTAAQHATGTIPIVFPTVPDPVGLGLVASLARPGGNTTGLSFQDPELMGKRLELLKEAVPGVTRVPYLWHSSRIVPRALGVQLQPVEVRDPYPFDQALATMTE